MKQETKSASKRKPTVRVIVPPITDSTRQEVGVKISSALDLMNDPRFRDEHFRQIEEKGVRSYSLSASNDDLFISFTIDWKGGLNG